MTHRAEALDTVWRDTSVAADVAALTSDLGEEARERAAAAAVWSCLLEPGDGTAGRLIGALGSRAALHAVATDDAGAARAAGIPQAEWCTARERWLPRADADAIRWVMRTSRAAGIRLVTRDSPEWPSPLDDLDAHAPSCLWVRGDPGALCAPGAGLAIVGARAATAYGEHAATEIAGQVAGRGPTIVSGAAYGIDGAAHRAALSVGGRTVAVLAGGVDRPYPSGHADLLGRVARNGAVIAEVPVGAAPTRWRFLQRNRLIAAISAGTLVVEAGSRSGSLNTAGHAATLGRGLGAVPGPVTSAASAGCHRLLREYDATCVTDADEAMELIGWAAEPVLFDSTSGAPDDARRVRDALSSRVSRPVEDIARRSGMAPREVAAHLGLLLLDGSVHEEAGRWLRR